MTNALFTHQSYRTFLREVMAEKARRNPRFSLRAMAKALDLAPGYLSTVLQGGKNLSPEMALRVAKRLGLKAKEAEYFGLLVRWESAKAPEVREGLRDQLERANPRPHQQVRDLSVDHFRIISDWYHFGILAALELGEPPAKPRALAQALGVSLAEVEAALLRLERLEMVEKRPDGEYAKTVAPPRVASFSPNEALRNFHRQTLAKAAESLDSQSPQEKVIGSETLAIDADQVEEFRALADEFFDRALALAAKGRKKDRVYHLGVQFFNFTPSLAKAAKKPRKET